MTSTQWIELAQAVGLFVIGGALAFLAAGLWRALGVVGRLGAATERLGTDVRPVLEHARAVSQDIRQITATVRGEVERVGDSVARATGRLDQALDLVAGRISELASLLEIVQEDLEEAFVSASATLRGIRAGARAVRRLRRDQEG